MIQDIQELLKLWDSKIDSFQLNIEKCQKIIGDMIDDAKKFQSNLKEHDCHLVGGNGESGCGHWSHEEQQEQPENEIQ